MDWAFSSYGRSANIFGGELEGKTPFRTPKLKGKENDHVRVVCQGPCGIQ